MATQTQARSQGVIGLITGGNDPVPDMTQGIAPLKKTLRPLVMTLMTTGLIPGMAAGADPEIIVFRMAAPADGAKHYL